MGDASPLPLQPGEIIDGKYRIDGELGQGAMGCVYEATHELLGDQVAIKCMLAPSAMAAQRFLREARVVRQIRSPHAVKVLDLGTLADGRPFLVMERLRGNDLEAHLRGCGALPLEQAADFVIQACDALAEAHRAGVVHRDLKPSNLFLTQGPDGLPFVKVLDFGVAKVLSLDEARQEQIRTAGPIGTPLYMSPEQIQAQEVDARSDVWSLGVLLFQMLTEQLPFEASSVEGLAVQICTAPPRSVASLRPGLPATLVEMINACLHRERELRPASVAEVATTLRPFASDSAAHLVDRIQRVAGTSAPPGAVPRASQPSEPEVYATAATLPESTEPLAPVLSLSARSQPEAPAPSAPPGPPPARGRKLALAVALVAPLGLVALLRSSPAGPLPALPAGSPAAPAACASTPEPSSSGAAKPADPGAPAAPAASPPPAASAASPPPAASAASSPSRPSPPASSPRGQAPAAPVASALPAASARPPPSPPSPAAPTSPPDPKQGAIRDRK